MDTGPLRGLAQRVLDVTINFAEPRAVLDQFLQNLVVRGGELVDGGKITPVRYGKLSGLATTVFFPNSPPDMGHKTEVSLFKIGTNQYAFIVLSAQSWSWDMAIPQLRKLAQSININPVVTANPTRPPTWTPTHTPTVDISDFTMTNAADEASERDVFQLRVPAVWHSRVPDSIIYSPRLEAAKQFLGASEFQPSVTVAVGTMAAIARDALQLNVLPVSDKDALERYRARSIDEQGITWGNVKPAKIGQLLGYSIGYVVDKTRYGPEGMNNEVRIAQLTPGRYVIVMLRVDHRMEATAKPVFEQILNTLKFMPTPALTQTSAALTAAPTATRTSTATLTSTATFNPQAFDWNTSQLYTSLDRVVSIPIPNNWTFSDLNIDPRVRKYTLDLRSNSRYQAQVNIHIFDRSVLDNPYGTAVPISSAKEFLTNMFSGNRAALQNAAITDVTVGKYQGFGIVLEERDRESFYRVAQVNPNQFIAILVYIDKPLVDLAEPTIMKMLENLEIHPELVPTVTPTSTPIAILMTATSIEGTVRAILKTPTARPPYVSPTPTTSSTPLPPSPCLGVKDPQNVTVPADGNTKQWAAPEQVIDPTHRYCAILTLATGRVVIELRARTAPLNVNSFVFLAQQGFYDNIPWFRVHSNLEAITGDPSGTGEHTAGYKLPEEFNAANGRYRDGNVLMVDNGSGETTSHFGIVMSFSTQGGTLIGRVVEGLNYIRQLKEYPQFNAALEPEKLLSVRIVDLDQK